MLTYCNFFLMVRHTLLLFKLTLLKLLLTILVHIAVYLAPTRFTGNVFPRPQGLQRWKLLVAWLSLAILTGLRPTNPEKEPLINQDGRTGARN